MQLPDFTHFKPFVQLRHQMQARTRGQFELFNPLQHLNGQERSELNLTGRQTRLQRLRRLADNTWAYKNSRLLVYLEAAPDYHVAQCQITHSWEAQQNIWISTRLIGALPLGSNNSSQRQVCEHCLQLLGYKGFDLSKNRKIAYSKKLQLNFARPDFFQLYTLYPVRGLADKLA